MPTTIEWTDHSWNPVTGCTNISPGCDNCYAEKITNRFKRHPWSEVTLHPDRIKVDPSWKPGQRIFLCSMGDLFHSAVPWEFIARVFDLMQAVPEFTFQVLTKRPGRMMFFVNIYWPNRAIGLGGDAMYEGRWPANVWAGTSVENQKYAARLDLLSQVPAPIRFVSYEPALGPVDFRRYLRWENLDNVPLELRGNMGRDALSNGVNWVIAGGESGSSARPAHPAWFRSVRDQCQLAGVPFFFKQWGEWILPPPGTTLMRVGKKAAGAMLDEREWREFPEVVR